MAVRTTAAGNIDTTVATLKTQVSTYIALQQTGSPGDDPAKLFWVWLVGQFINQDAGLAQTIRTANMYDPTSWGKTLSQTDGFA